MTDPLVFQDQEIPISITWDFSSKADGSYILRTIVPMCLTCGSLVLDPLVHQTWHSDLGPHGS